MEGSCRWLPTFLLAVGIALIQDGKEGEEQYVKRGGRHCPGLMPERPACAAPAVGCAAGTAWSRRAVQHLSHWQQERAQLTLANQQ